MRLGWLIEFFKNNFGHLHQWNLKAIILVLLFMSFDSIAGNIIFDHEIIKKVRIGRTEGEVIQIIGGPDWVMPGTINMGKKVTFSGYEAFVHFYFLDNDRLSMVSVSFIDPPKNHLLFRQIVKEMDKSFHDTVALSKLTLRKPASKNKNFQYWKGQGLDVQIGEINNTDRNFLIVKIHFL